MTIIAFQQFGLYSEDRAGFRLNKAVAAVSLGLCVACSSTPDRIAFSQPGPAASVQEIHIAASRLPSVSTTDPRQDRNAKVKYARFDVSIPPGHALGRIEWPHGPASPEKGYAVIRKVDLGSARRLLESLSSAPGNEVALYVHGFNTTPSEALYRFSQIGHDFEITSPKLLFAWPSAGQPTGYVYDRDSVLFSRDALADLLTDIGRRTNKQIVLMAHSMGGHLVMEVMRQLAMTGRRDVIDDLEVVVLLAPDIDPDLFRAQVSAVGELPDPFVIMTSQDDRALRLSAIVNIGRQKVGNLSRADTIAGLDITLFDFTDLADGSSGDHLVPFTSPAAIRVLRDLVHSGARGNPDLSQFDIGADGVIRARSPNSS